MQVFMSRYIIVIGAASGLGTLPCQTHLLCRIGYAYEQATEWHTLRPPV
jgi:hypothetical protein